jgi:hypothetical protein
VTKHKIDLDTVKQMLNDLRESAEEYDSHPLATEEAIEALTAGVDPIPPLLCPQEGGGWALIQALGMRAVNDLGSLFSYSKRDKPLKPKERLTKEEPLIIGYIAIWFRDIRPALKMPGVPDRAVSYGEVIEAGQSLPAVVKLIEMSCLNEKDRTRHLTWIRDLFEQTGKQGELGKRKLIGYHDKALRYFAERIVEAAQNAGCNVEELLLQEPATIESQAIQVVQLSEAISSPELGWRARLSQCLADYRTYELQEIERLLGEVGLSPSFEWFLDRRVSYQVKLSRDETGPHTVGLADICKPGLRVALLDIRGSGTTTALLWLSSRYCRDVTAIGPVVLRLDAKDYKKYAADQSPVKYLAKKIYGTGYDSRTDRKEFEDVLGNAEIICLIDNLTRLQPGERPRITQHFGSVSGLVFTAGNWLSGEELSEIGEGTVRVELAPLNKAPIQQFITEFADRSGPDFDELLAQRLARDMPGIAVLPLGLVTLCEQVCLCRGHCAAIVARFISELFRRDGKPAPEWQQDDNSLPSAIRLPMRLTVPMYAWPEVQSGTHFDFGEQWALEYLPKGLRGQWKDAIESPFLAKIGPETYRFLNREVFGFLVAMATIKGAGWQCGKSATREMFEPGIVGIANRHYYAWTEHPDWIE